MMTMTLTHEELISYVIKQLETFFPDGKSINVNMIKTHLKTTLTRLNKCINAVKMWPIDTFDHLHSTQYTIFLYFLANTIWNQERDKELCTKLFYLNKSLNGIDLFYEVEMPEIFFIGHSSGIVLAKATYSNYLAIYQNCTVGKNHGIAPLLEEGVVMYPNSAVIGRSTIKKGSIISQGTSVINQDTMGDCIVFADVNKTLHFKHTTKNILEDIFRLE